jgi:hypothetical protein
LPIALTHDLYIVFAVVGFLKPVFMCFTKKNNR